MSATHPKTHEEVIRLAREGVSRSEIATRTGYCYSTVRAVLSRAGMGRYSYPAPITNGELSRLRAVNAALLTACEHAYSLIGQQYAGPSLEVSLELAAAIALAKGATS